MMWFLGIIFGLLAGGPIWLYFAAVAISYTADFGTYSVAETDIYMEVSGIEESKRKYLILERKNSVS